MLYSICCLNHRQQNATVAQSVVHLIRNQKVTSSSLVSSSVCEARRSVSDVGLFSCHKVEM